MVDLILSEQMEGIVYLTLNQPDKRNALSLALLQQLHVKLTAIQRDPSVRVVILRANGPVFSAGHDLKELAASDENQLRAMFHLCGEVMELLPALPQPVIAQVHALATAAGCQLVASCDLIIASTAASFATPGVKVGLFCTTPGIPLVRALPEKIALEMLLTGTAISADQAHRWGLVNRVTSPETLAEETLNVARKITAASPRVIAEGKRAFYHQAKLDRAAAYAYAEPLMVAQAQAPDCREGVAAFVQKRPPQWSGLAAPAS